MDSIYVMLAELPKQSLYKIGFSSDVDERLVQINAASPVPVALLMQCPVTHGRKVERRLHGRYADCRVRGEWFALARWDEEMFRFLVREEDAAFVEAGGTPRSPRRTVRETVEEVARSVLQHQTGVAVPPDAEMSGYYQPVAQLLDAREVANLTSFKEASVRRLAREGAMPRSIHLGRNITRWRRSDIEEWIAAGCPNLGNPAEQIPVG